MLKRTLMVFVAVLTFGGIFTATTTTPVDAHASVHYIKWHCKKYKSKYTIKQMRKKYHLKYKKSKFYGYTTKDNYFYGITTKGAYQHRSTDVDAFPTIHHKGTYAMFRSKTFDGGNAYGLDYVNLKTGKHYHDQA
ncbi:hypothetical protein [Levilactobacillus tongjiangensis]|uniref:Uncharacterized protein n=1 Tax=Levilactobacillus tongjiangensis TaxID=2486023 RepID=A0ABW1STP0_9LACO|nr:hypothetical protein [Levilactobacillus tongjiangensis]